MRNIIISIISLLLISCSLNKGQNEGFTHIVKSGDTLTGISQKYNVSEDEIKYQNDKYFTSIKVGERLFIPSPTLRPTTKKANSSSEKRLPVVKSKKGITYTVKRGDNLYRISKNFNMSLAELKKLNSLTSDHISPGDRLLISKATASKSKKSNTSKKKSSSSKNNITSTKSKTSQNSSTSKKKTTIYAEKKVGKISSFPREWEGEFILPISGKISSPFGMRNGRLHKGVDISAPPGTNIKVAYSGTVSYTGFLSDYGNVVIVKHGKDIATVYAHNEINLVKKSDKVNTGDIIGRVGSTGRSSGPHLHFEIRVANKPVKPNDLIKEINDLKPL
ncbi:MAG: hypothetical protein B6226_01855 [Candidatus Cloacimonetes bacterium 4572_65]|nr:MAG: hypothetical protein B6226_01855 [Candidatus Cloacimonetes bacterium 4572_65]